MFHLEAEQSSVDTSVVIIGTPQGLELRSLWFSLFANYLAVTLESPTTFSQVMWTCYIPQMRRPKHGYRSSIKLGKNMEYITELEKATRFHRTQMALHFHTMNAFS